MPIDYDYLFKLKNHYASSNVSVESKEDIVAKLQSTMQNELDNNYIDEYVVKKDMPYFQNNVVLNFKNVLSVVFANRKYKEVVYDSLAKTILLEKNIIDVGDYITITEEGLNRIYLVMSKPLRKKTHDEAFMLNCQYKVRILDDDGVTIHDYYVFFQSNKSRPGVNERAETGVTENSTFQAYIRHDNISRRLIDTTNDKSNKISRVIIDGLAYKIVGSDPVSMKGLITLGLELSTIDSINDNLELGIADYWNNIKQPTPPPEDLVINCEYDDLIIGETNTYTITTDNTVTWGLSDNGVIATLGLIGVNGQCTVTCPYNTKLIGEIVTLTAYLDYGATVTKEIPIVGWM